MAESRANKNAIRQAFDRAAASYDRSAFLQQEVARRLDEHLDEIKVQPEAILDAGCGTGSGVPLLRGRFPKARILGLDLAHGMVAHMTRQHGALSGWRGRMPALLSRMVSAMSSSGTGLTALCADLEQLPLARDCVDMVWSSLTLQWVDLPRAFSEVQRVLKPGGLFLFASLGPDTLHELRTASRGLDGYAHVNQFMDMHDVGDALLHAGFVNPVMEMERITLTYEELRGLLADIKGIGAHTVVAGRRAGLMGKEAWRTLAQNYEAFRRDGRLPATYEIVYGHAWAGTRDALPDGRQVIQFKKRPTP